MTPADLRAKAKVLRAEASKLIREADDIEAEQAAAHRRANSRAALEAKAATMCRPVWKSEGLDGVYVVAAIENGCFLVRNLQAVGGTMTAFPYRTRDGRFGGSMYLQTTDTVRRARLDHVATMLAWRAWCAERKAATERNPPAL